MARAGPGPRGPLAGRAGEGFQAGESGARASTGDPGDRSRRQEGHNTSKSLQCPRLRGRRHNADRDGAAGGLSPDHRGEAGLRRPRPRERPARLRRKGTGPHSPGRDGVAQCESFGSRGPKGASPYARTSGQVASPSPAMSHMRGSSAPAPPGPGSAWTTSRSLPPGSPETGPRVPAEAHLSPWPGPRRTPRPPARPFMGGILAQGPRRETTDADASRRRESSGSEGPARPRGAAVETLASPGGCRCWPLQASRRHRQACTPRTGTVPDFNARESTRHRPPRTPRGLPNPIVAGQGAKARGNNRRAIPAVGLSQA